MSYLSGHTFEVKQGKDGESGDPMGIASGTWYFLNHSDSGFSCWLPVNDSVTYGFSHNYKDKDVAGMGIVQTALDSPLGTLVQRNGGIGGRVGGSAIFADSSPHVFTVNSKIFSATGSGNLIQLVDKLRSLSSAKLSGGDDGGNYQAGAVTFPGTWQVNVMSFAGGSQTTVSEMKDMLCLSCGATMNSPWISGGGTTDPQTVEIRMDFRYAMNTFDTSMKIGGKREA